VVAPSEVFVPRLQYPNGPQVELSAGRFSHDGARQILRWDAQGASGLISLRISR